MKRSMQIHNDYGSRLSLMSIIIIIFLCACASRIPNRVPRAMRSSIKGTVVIDAGHGGEDSGAVSSKGIKEKDLTLDIALKVKQLMSQVMPKVRVVLTRDRDVFVSLEQRISIAHEAKGDLFVSIHINSSEKKDASGFEIYSLDVASDRHAERLAARENGKSTEREVRFILEDLRANGNRRDSDRLASFISQGLANQLAKKVERSSINDRGYNQAIFQILFVKMPAVLAELLFISNDKEVTLLEKPDVRKHLAQGLIVGINKFLVEKAEKVGHASAR